MAEGVCLEPGAITNRGFIGAVTTFVYNLLPPACSRKDTTMLNAARPVKPRICLGSFLGLILALLMVTAQPGNAELSNQDIAALQQRADAEGWTFEVGENEATQYSLEDLCGLRMPENWRDSARFVNLTPMMDLPDYFDWRDVDGCTIVKNQGGCGSCWAFATVGALECAIKIKDGLEVDLSEQWLVNCNSNGWGCDGGFFAHDYHEWKTDACGGTGAVLEDDCPYVAQDRLCDCPYDHWYTIESWAYIGNPYSVPPVDQIKQAIITYGPVSVGVYANAAMQAYNGGVFNGCASGATNHAVVLVGWDDNQGTEGVWFMRNSWGTGWGEDGGYMRMPYGCSSIGEGACFVDYGPLGPKLTREGFAINDVSGDGNNRPDPGETGVELTVTVDNFGTDAVGLTMQVTASDPEIVFTDASADFGDVLRWQQVTNTADPIVFAVDPAFPPTIVEFILNFSANGGEYTFADTVHCDVGQPQFIIVDHDESNPSDYEQYYVEILDLTRTPHVVWGVDSLASPPVDTLNEYSFTIWFTGDHRTEVLSVEDVNILRNFLDQGGRLFLTGQDIAADLADDADSTFLQEYLYVRFVPGAPLIMADGVDGDPISDGHLVALGGSGGAANQNSPDILAPLTGIAKPVYTYYGSSDVAGVRVAYDDYRVVFFGFGFEGIADDLGYTTRAEIWPRVFDWLSQDGVIFIPGDLNCDGMINPIDVVHLVNYVYRDSDPPLILNSGDVNADCQVNPVDVVYLVNFVFRNQGELFTGCAE